MHIPAHSPKWANMPPRGLKEAPKLLFKNTENARTIRQKSSQASGWHVKSPNMQFLSCFTMQTGPRLQKPQFLLPFFSGSQEAPGRPPRGLQEGSLQPCFQEAPKTPPRDPQEASKRQNVRMVPAFSSFLERHIFGIRYSGFCTLGSKTRPSVLQSGENARTIR